MPSLLLAQITVWTGQHSHSAGSQEFCSAHRFVHAHMFLFHGEKLKRGLQTCAALQFSSDLQTKSLDKGETRTVAPPDTSLPVLPVIRKKVSSSLLQSALIYEQVLRLWNAMGTPTE